MKTALVTGYPGQDAVFLSRHLLGLGYRVVALQRRSSQPRPQYINDPQFVIRSGDLTSVNSLISCLQYYEIDEIYNLAAQSHVGDSFEQPDMTSMVDYIGLVNLVVACEAVGEKPKLYQASSSEMYGTGHDELINEDTPFNPNSPYAIAKVAAHYYIRSLRAQGWFACAGILFNHESELRGQDFVTQKIARAMATGERLVLGNIFAKRDWGYAGDYVQAMHLMMQADKADEYVIGTGVAHTVKDFVDEAARYAGRVGEGYVMNDPRFIRPLDITCLRADASKAKRVLGWAPTVTFKQLVKLMVDHQKELNAKNN